MAKFSLREGEGEEEEETRTIKRRKTHDDQQEEDKLGDNSPSSSRGIRVNIDPDLLDCSICFNPLHPPLYQCLNGHVACSQCWSRLRHTCHICNLQVVTHNIALEKVLESIQIPCSFAEKGCLESFAYSQKEAHEKNCRFRPFPCPIPNCSHKGISGNWLEHFEREHKFHQINFSYNEFFNLKINQSDPYLILINPNNNNPLLLINKPIDKIGHKISLFYSDPRIRDYDLVYEITVMKNTSKLQLKSEVSFVENLKGDEFGGIFLIVPLGFCESGIIEADILIKKL